jgi:DNA-binding MarR family transcriptional regulator
MSKTTAVGGPPAMAADGPLGYALVQAAKAHKARASELLRGIGLYPGQELLLMHLWDRDEQTQAELVRALNLDASTVTRTVTRLEQQGIVRTRASARDRRAVIVALTPRGRRLCPEVRRVWGELEALTTEGMSERRRGELARALRRIADTLTAPEG